jgi:erythromycin esterase
MKYQLATTVLAFVLVFFPCVAVGQNDPAGQDFLEWARRSLSPLSTGAVVAERSDLQSLRGMIGNATIVAFGEGGHGVAEYLEFRNRLFQYLVEQLGFTTIAIESGITEGQLVHDYVLNGSGDIETVLADGFSWTSDRFPQNQALVRWMREYNAGPNHPRKVQFYGFDVPGSPGNDGVKRRPRTALDEALKYLDGVDPDAAAAQWRRVSSFPNTLAQYGQLSQADRDQLTAAIGDVISLFERRETAYMAASSPQAYQWGYRSAIGARQVDAYFRRIPIGWTMRDPWSWLDEAHAVRDRAMADNLRWVSDELGPDGKMMIFAARFHIAAAALSYSTPMMQITRHSSLGTYLRRRYGGRLLTIGTLLGPDKYAGQCRTERSPAPAGSIEWLLSQLNSQMFILDLRAAPPSVASWLNQTHDLWDGEGTMSTEAGKAFDIVFFSSRETPAGPCPSSR